MDSYLALTGRSQASRTKGEGKREMDDSGQFCRLPVDCNPTGFNGSNVAAASGLFDVSFPFGKWGTPKVTRLRVAVGVE